MRITLLVCVAFGLEARVGAAEPPAQVDRFDDPLPAGAIMRLGTLRGHADITSLGIAADGSVLTVGNEADLHVWFPERDSPEPVVQLPIDRTKNSFALRAAVSPDAKRIACIMRAPEAVVLYDWRGDQPPAEKAALHIKSPQEAVFSPDGNTVAVITRPGAAGVVLWDVKTLKSSVLDETLRDVVQVCFSADGQRVGATTGQEFLLWDVKTGRELGRWSLKGFMLFAVSLDSKGETLAARVLKVPDQVYLDVRFLDAKTGQPRPGLKSTAGGDWTTCAPDGKTVLIGDKTGVRWWNPAAGQLVRHFDGATNLGYNSVSVLARFTPDAKTLIATSGNVLFRWDAKTGQPRFKELHNSQHYGPVAALGASADGKLFATGDGARIKVWDAGTGKALTTVPAAHPLTDNLAFAPDGKSLFAPSSQPGQLSQWDVATGKERRRFTADPKLASQSMTLGICLSDDGKVLTAVTLSRLEATERPVLTTWDANTGARQTTKELDRDQWRQTHYRVSFSPNALHASIHGNVFLTTEGPARDRLPPRALGPGFSPGVFSGNGNRVAFSYVSSSDPERRMCGVVYDPVTGAKIRDLPPGSGGRVALSPNGNILAAASVTELTFWDVNTGDLLGRYKSPTAEKGYAVHSFARALRFTPDGTKLLTSHADATALVWLVPASSRK